jgi:uncharacterized protein
MDLRPAEVRVLGCLLEKQRTTPDAYPLSLNALRLACNQSTNRDPVVDYDEAVIRDAVHRLERRGFARLASGAGSRAAKFRHLLNERLPLDDAEQSVLCVLMLRGPQTPGELKQRTERLYGFASLEQVHEALALLIERRLVQREQRRPGQKEERYAHLLSADEQQPALERTPTTTSTPTPAEPAPPPAAAAQPEDPAGERDPASVGELERRVALLERQVAELRAALGA